MGATYCDLGTRNSYSPVANSYDRSLKESYRYAHSNPVCIPCKYHSDTFLKLTELEILNKYKNND